MNHNEVCSWIRAHNGFPALIAGTEMGESGGISAVEIGFDATSPDLQRISWEEFFTWFERHTLALRYNDNTDDGLNRFEFVDRYRATGELSPDVESVDSEDGGA